MLSMETAWLERFTFARRDEQRIILRVLGDAD